MSRPIFIAALVGVCMLGTLGNADQVSWSGLYKGLDARDGSIDYLSIVPTGPDTFDIRIMPSAISSCESGVGWVLAEGRLESDGTITRHNSIRVCDGVDRQDMADAVFQRDPETGVVSFGASDDGRALYFHPISIK